MNEKKANTLQICHLAFRTGVLVLLGGSFGLAAAAAVDVLTSNYDNERTNANLNETILNTNTVRPETFGKIGSYPVDGHIMAQPLYVSGVQIDGKGIRNVVFTATMHNSVYAFDADAPNSLFPLWRVFLGASVPSSTFNFTDILPEVGILSTPVIDPERQVIYVVSDTLEGGVPVFRIHALALSNGQEMLNGPVAIAASVPGAGAGSNNGKLSLDATLQLQRPGLALANGIVYVAFGSHGDFGDFHGWMIGYDASDLRHVAAVFNTTPNAWGGSFWHAGRAPAIDSTGNIYGVTGNGKWTGKLDFGDSVLKLSGRGLSLLDWYTPNNYADLSARDMDLGSSGVILVPGANQVLTGAKTGDLWMIDSNSMGHLAPLNSATVQSIKANDGGIYAFALWNRANGPVVYVHESYGTLRAYGIHDGRLDSTVLSKTEALWSTRYAGVSVSANHDSDGIVWQITGDWDVRQIPGTLHAYDATDLTLELWNSEMISVRDHLGRYAKFVAPTVANGRVYVPTSSGQLAIYGLLPGVSQSSPGMELSWVANAASLLAGAVSPGELVAIFGANIGPQPGAQQQVDDSGHVTNVLADTQVLFDGVAAPLLYTSYGEIDAVVPFEVSGTTQMQVIYRGQHSSTIAIPVVDATPALFDSDGTGGGQGAILNEDGSQNSDDNPADRGSVVVLSGTGFGQTIPAGEDGKVNGGAKLPIPKLPVNVTIDGQTADVLYVGGAPGMVQGLVQINVRIPNNVEVDCGDTQCDLTVTVKVGKYADPGLITVAVRAQ